MKYLQAMKKFLVFVVSVSFLVGCSPVELEFYQLIHQMKTMEQTKPVMITGEVTVDFNTMPKVWRIGADEVVSLELMKSILSQYAIAYEKHMDGEAERGLITYFAVEKKTGEKTKILSVPREKNVNYIPLDQLIDFLKSFLPKDHRMVEYQNIGIRGKWIQVTDQELKNMYESFFDPAFTFDEKAAAEVISVKKQQAIQKSFMDGLMREVYNGYSPGMMKKQGSAYQMNITMDQLVGVWKSAVEYSLGQNQKIGAYIKDFIRPLSEYEVQLLGLKQSKDVLLDQTDKSAGINFVSMEGIQLQQFDSMQKVVREVFAGSSIQKTWEKRENDCFVTTTTTVRKMQEPVEKVLNMDMKVVSTERMEEADVPEVTIPTEQTMTYLELKRIWPQTMEIHLDTGAFTYTSGYKETNGRLDLMTKEGAAYIPMSRIERSLGEKILWDTAQQKAHTVYREQKVVLDHVLGKSGVYIRVRDLEKIGYTMQYDAPSRTISIQR